MHGVENMNLPITICSQVQGSHISHDEKEAIFAALEAGECFGYGNVIAWLRTTWAVKLRDNYGLDEETAIASTVSSPYQLPPKIKE